MTITEHPLFERLAPYIKIEVYARDGGHKKPRRRIELNSKLMDKKLLQEALAVVVVLRVWASDLTVPVQAERLG